MGCGCGKNRKARAAGIQFVYDYTAPGGETVTPYGTHLEAKREMRKFGGGTIKRRQVKTEPAA